MQLDEHRREQRRVGGLPVVFGSRQLDPWRMCLKAAFEWHGPSSRLAAALDQSERDHINITLLDPIWLAPVVEERRLAYPELNWIHYHRGVTCPYRAWSAPTTSGSPCRISRRLMTSSSGSSAVPLCTRWVRSSTMTTGCASISTCTRAR